MKKLHSVKKWLLLGTTACLSTVATSATITLTSSQADSKFTPDNPTTAYTLSEGEATKTTDGLVWSRCLVGQMFENDACTGDPTEFASWELALANLTADQKNAGWRIPNIKELMSITDSTRAFPSVNTDVFVFAKTFKFSAEYESYPKGLRAPSPAYLWSSTPVRHKVVKIDASYKALTKTESTTQTNTAGAQAKQVYALDLSYGQAKTAYRDGTSRGENESSQYSKPDPDKVEKARYVLLVKTQTN